MDEKKFTLNHFSHTHPLTLNFIHYKSDHDRPVFSCFGCQQEMSVPSYKCDLCHNFSLHKVCAELPSEMKHPLHPQHPLTLLAKPPTSHRGRTKCSVCQRPCESFTYHCTDCNFNVDAVCASLEQSIKHEAHEHPLIPHQRPALFLCDACGTKHEGSSYKCTTCQFWINQLCVFLPSTFQHLNHDHPLRLTYSLQDEDYEFDPDCDICGDEVNYRVNWFYYCDECKFISHVYCAPLDSKLDDTSRNTVKKTKVTAKEVLENNVIIHLPLTDEYVDPKIPQFMEKSILPSQRMKRNATQMIYHVSHHHPLCFVDFSSPFTSTSSSPGSSILVCDGCEKAIFPPYNFYRCTKIECNFSFHKTCANLPIELRHRDHEEHPLILNRWQPSSYCNLPLCKGCNKQCTGVSFGCLTCNFFLDIECALLQGNIVREGYNENSLVLTEKRNGNCGACEKPLLETALISADFTYGLHLLCAFSPRTIKHKCDKHCLIMSYPIDIPANSPTRYQCEICKKEINPRSCWFYYCRYCNHSLHMKCVHRFLFMIKHEAHEHALVLDATLDFHCAACDYHCYGIGVAFICVRCKFKLHIQCAFLPHTVQHRYDEHPYTLTYYGNPEEYYCGICEEKINPEVWFYNCVVCDQSLHILCLLDDEDVHSNIKVRDEYHSKAHQHLLSYIQQPKDVSPCKMCDKLVEGSALECPSCGYRYHINCARDAKPEGLNFMSGETSRGGAGATDRFPLHRLLMSRSTAKK